MGCSTAAMMSRSNRSPILPVLGALCGILCAGLIYRHHTASAEKKQNAVAIKHYSNEWVQASARLQEQTAVNLAMEREYATQAEELKTISNTLTTVSVDLANAQTAAKAAADTAREEQARQDARIAELETQRDGMTQTMSELTNSISILETQIAETQQRLKESSSDRETLMVQLKRLQAEKSDLEKRFYDLAQLRQQIRALRDELSIGRRLAWIRRGLYGNLKGAEVLRKGLASTSVPSKNFNLDVEITRQEAAKSATSEIP